MIHKVRIPRRKYA